jgi:4-hydroxybenzoate polyprenyltransferase/phosphoserine phosphatase
MPSNKDFINMPLQKFPLCIDLDGTLLHSDILYESSIKLILTKPWLIFSLLLWILKSKAWLKHQVAQRVDLATATLPYNKAVLDFIREEYAQGRTLILATASNEKYAYQIAEHLGIFTETVASSATVNLSGSKKLEVLISKYGEGQFDYMGNSYDDIDVWKGSRTALIVNATNSIIERANRVSKVTHTWPRKSSAIKQLTIAMRIYQWPKNLLIFVNILMAHQLTNPLAATNTFLAFISFCLCASSVYIINDLYDLDADREHSTKCMRPFAAGSLSLLSGVLASVTLLLVSITIAINVSSFFVAVLLLYFLVTLLYSFRLKTIAIVDVLVLAGLYTLRIIAGAAVVNLIPSFWLLAFSMFLFTSLAVIKRYTELNDAHNDGKPLIRRGYGYDDIEILQSLGVTSGYMAILVLALYINSSQVSELYRYPEAIWMLCPLMMYWVSRIWLIAKRQELHQDPVVFAIKDKQSYFIAAMGLFVLWLAS